MLRSDRVLGVTLARAGSKRIPAKNIRPLCGVPLLSYTISQALRADELTDYVVSTDSEEVADVAREAGAEVPFLRPSDLSTDTASSVGALQHAVNFMEKRIGERYGFVVELMATNPFKTFEDIDTCVRNLKRSGADSVIAVHEVGDEHPARVKQIRDGLLIDFGASEPLESRRQDLVPRAYVRSGAIYALTRNELMVANRRYGSDFSLPYILPPEKAVNIDSELDWKLAEVLMHERQASRKVDESN